MATVIDLDARPRGARRRPGRRWWAAAHLIAVVPALAGSAQPALPTDPATVLQGDGVSAVASDESAMYVLSRDNLAAYWMPDGARRWAVPVSAGTQLLGVDEARLVVGVQDSASLADAALIGIDAATGAPVWQRTGYVPVVHGCACADGVSELYPPGGDAELERQRSTPYLAGIDLRTGAVRWSLVTAPGGISTVVFRSDRRVQIAVLDADGTLRLHSGETAEVVRTVRLEDLGTVDGLALSGNRLLAYRAEQRNIIEGAVVDLTTGRRMWERTAGYLSWCGEMLCAWEETGATVGLDRDTGRERWRLDGELDLAGLTAAYLLATPSTPVDGSGPVLVLDAATGRVVRRLDGWMPAGDLAGTRLLVAGRGAAGTTLIARLDIETGAATVLGRAARSSDPPECFTTGPLLACQLDHDRIPVWRPGS